MSSLSTNVLSILSASRVDGNKVFLPNVQLDRKSYQDVNKVLDALGGKWSKKEKAHIFNDDPTEQLEEVIMLGRVEKKKNPLKELGFFPTPNDLARYVVNQADINHDHFVLEPSAGSGQLLKALNTTDKDIHTVCYEINPDMQEGLLELADEVFISDFLLAIPEPKFDRVVMNPPFNKSRADIHHVLHAFKFLKGGGRLVAIMPSSITFRNDKLTNEFRDMVLSFGQIEALPENSFKESGTLINTVLVTLNKEPQP